MKETLLSVCLITYNHKDFIRQAIDSVLMQKVNFSWELIIADDCSTDGTRDIVIEYKNKYPDFIKLILQEKNVGPAQNWTDLISTPKSKYIAYFEGDDYWTDSHKLQKQVDFLSKNLDYSITSGNTYIINKNNKIVSRSNESSKDVSIIDQINTNIFGQMSCTILFRSKCLNPTNITLLQEAPFGDWGLSLLCLKHGKGKIINDTLGCYRVHNKGLWNGLTVENQFLKILHMYDFIIKMFPEYYHEATVSRDKYLIKILNKHQKNKSYIKKILNKFF
jgi:glycosyltransferase involved in cell wall biosynthesis